MYFGCAFSHPGIVAGGDILALGKLLGTETGRNLSGIVLVLLNQNTLEKLFMFLIRIIIKK